MARKKRKSIPWGLPSSIESNRRRKTPPAEGGWTWTTRPSKDGKPSRYRSIRSGATASKQSPPLRLINNACNQGKEALRKSDFEGAIGHFTRALQLNPRHAESYKLRGDGYASLGQYDNALRDYRDSVRIDPRNAGAYFGEGVALYNKGRDHWLSASYAFMNATFLDTSLEHQYRELPSKPSIDYDLVPRVDVDLILRWRAQGRTGREVIEACRHSANMGQKVNGDSVLN
jgi:tetratricopeptide (TPR) repeat protein